MCEFSTAKFSCCLSPYKDFQNRHTQTVQNLILLIVYFKTVFLTNIVSSRLIHLNDIHEPFGYFLSIGLAG